MNFISKKYILFFLFFIFSFLLISPELSLAAERGDTKPVICNFYNCKINESVDCGTATYKCRTCCSTCTDPETGNTYSCEPCWDCDCCWHYSCRRETRTQYKASGKDCEPIVERRICRGVCSHETEGLCGCGGCKIECGIWENNEWKAGQTETCEACKSWQKAVSDSCENPDSEEWCTKKPECKCCGCPGDSDCAPEESCVETPINLKIYQSPVSDTRVDKLNNIRLPIRLAWDDVPGWYGGWQAEKERWGPYDECKENNRAECEEIFFHLRDCCGWFNPAVNGCLEELCEDFLPGKDDPACAEMCPAIEEENGEDKPFCPGDFVESYVIEITGEFNSCYDNYGEDGDGYDGEHMDENTYRAVITDESQFFPPCPCFFKSGRTYNWKVRACCTDDGKNCGPWSKNEPEMQFTTSRAPEPILPFDPDWIDKGGAEDLDFEQSRDLEWCEIEDSTYYHSTSGLFLPLSYRILIYYFNEDEGKYLCHPLLLEEGNKCVPEYLGPEDVFPPNKFFARNFITRDSAYAWQIAACRDYIADDCGPYSQEWRFSTTTWDLGLSRSDPPDNKEISVGLPLRLAWVSSFSNSFNYRIYKGEVASCGAGGTIAADRILDDEMILNHKEVEGPLKILELDTVYTWCIQPCRDFEAKDCDPWGGPWYFKTTGRPPKLDTMKPDEDNVFIPTEFSWEKIPGAESYWFQLNGKDPILIPGKEAKIELDYPDLRPESSYSWKVQTCAQVDGQICGDYSLNQTFKTFKWQKPSDPKPGDGEKLSGNTISWEKSPGADFSEYTLTFVELDKDEQRQEECQKEIDKTIDSGITSRSSVNLSMGLGCWGKYRWKIVPCLDENCDEKGPESVWFFTFKATFLPPDAKPGLIPCNQPFYYPERPWVDETESCGIKHLFIVLFIIIDFLFINVLPMILVLLVLASGVIFYFSIRMEAPDPAAKVKSLWKAAGIGIGLMLFAWIITASLLTLFGYHLGPWHIFG